MHLNILFSTATISCPSTWYITQSKRGKVQQERLSNTACPKQSFFHKFGGIPSHNTHFLDNPLVYMCCTDSPELNNVAQTTGSLTSH